MWKTNIVPILAAVLLLAACGPAHTGAKGPGTATPGTTEQLRPPILTEAQAVEAALEAAYFSRPELGEGEEIRNPTARLMTLQEYEDRFTQGRSYQNRSRPVWVVQMEGEWQRGGIAPPGDDRTFSYGVMVLDAHTGENFSGSFRFEPIPLEEAEGMDPDAFARYPLEVSLPRAREIVDFPAAEPGYLPEGFSLERTTLELAHPMQETLPYSGNPNQSVILHYSNGEGQPVQVSESRIGLPDLMPGAEPFAIQGGEAWRGETPNGWTWVGWKARYSNGEGGVVLLTYILHSADGAASLDELRRVAESFPEGQPPVPTATPAPEEGPTEAATTAPTPTAAPPASGRAVSCNPESTGVPCEEGVEVGEEYLYRLYTHCGIRSAYFNGQWWIADPVLEDNYNSPQGWGNPFDVGTMQLTQENQLLYRSSGGQSAAFRALAPGEEYQPYPCY